jgi:hypothetical protein
MCEINYAFFPQKIWECIILNVFATEAQNARNNV